MEKEKTRSRWPMYYRIKAAEAQDGSEIFGFAPNVK
jgi:hypothetical protein